MNIDKGFAEYDQPHESQTNKDILETIVRWGYKYSPHEPWMGLNPDVDFPAGNSFNIWPECFCIQLLTFVSVL